MSHIRRGALPTAFLLLLLGAGCPPVAFDGLDSNRDGALGADDLESGAAAAYIDLGPEGSGVDTEAGDDDDDAAEDTATGWQITEATLYPAFSEGDWYFQGVLEGESTNYALSIRFENEDPLAVGSGDVVGGSFNAEDNSVYAYGGETPGGTMEITEASDTVASGALTSPVRFEIIENDSFTGRVVVIEGFAFRDVEIGEALTD